MKKMKNKDSQIIIYQSKDGKIFVDTLMKDKTVWLSQKSLAMLFDCS